MREERDSQHSRLKRFNNSLITSSRDLVNLFTKQKQVDRDSCRIYGAKPNPKECYTQTQPLNSEEIQTSNEEKSRNSIPNNHILIKMKRSGRKYHEQACTFSVTRERPQTCIGSRSQIYSKNLKPNRGKENEYKTNSVDSRSKENNYSK